MFGLILSKSADRYAFLASQKGLPAQQFISTNNPNALSSSDKKRISWLLAEPSLALNILNDLPNLRWLQSTWAGVESLLSENIRKDYLLTNIRGLFAPLMTEYIFAHMLAHERAIKSHYSAMQHKKWLNEPNGVIRGKTLLIMGVGSIGKGVAQAAKVFGMTTLGLLTAQRQIEGVDETGTINQLPQFLARADYVVNILPHTPQTQGMINATFFSQMKTTAVFINVGRGQTVTEEDLISALKKQQIAGAVLDVYKTEPLPTEHLFWETPNLTLTSHTAAPSLPDEIFDVFWRNYLLFEKQESLLHQVDFTRGY